VKINETIPRIRAAISAVQVRAAAAVPVMAAAVQVPYIVYDYVLGVFVKFLTRADVVKLFSDTDMSMAKPFADQYTVADFPDVVPNKRFADAVEVDDALSPFQIGKGLFENPKIEEGAYFAEDYTDPGYTVTAVEVSFTKTRSDNLAAADALFALNMTLSSSDAVSMVDSIAFARIISFTDAADAASITVLSAAKSFADQYTVADFPDVVPHKRFSDDVDTADTVVIVANLGIVDEASIADSGSIRMQDYCDFTYFAEDYVGEARTF
jgi:hypothetical protein